MPIPSLKLITAPPIMMLYYGATIVAARQVFSFDFIALADWLGLVFIAMGLGIILWSVIIFKNLKTTVNPYKVREATKLVTSGPFRVSRNPMYLGMVVILIGVSFCSTSALGFALSALFGIYLDRAQIDREEKAMNQLFGQEFQDYKLAVRRWI